MNGQYDEDEAFREILNKQEQLTLFESVYVDFWGTGLNQVRTEHTGHKKWPGQNIQTYLSENSRKPPRRFESVQRNPQGASNSQRHILDISSSIRKSDKKKLTNSRLLCKTTPGLRVNL